MRGPGGEPAPAPSWPSGSGAGGDLPVQVVNAGRPGKFSREWHHQHEFHPGDDGFAAAADG
jgi:hypothetical protein